MTLYHMSIGNRRFTIKSQFEEIIDKLKEKPASLSDIVLNSRMSRRTIQRYIRVLESNKIIESFYPANSKGTIKILMLNRKADFDEVAIDPRLFKW